MDFLTAFEKSMKSGERYTSDYLDKKGYWFMVNQWGNLEHNIPRKLGDPDRVHFNEIFADSNYYSLSEKGNRQRREKLNEKAKAWGIVGKVSDK